MCENPKQLNDNITHVHVVGINSAFGDSYVEDLKKMSGRTKARAERAVMHIQSGVGRGPKVRFREKAFNLDIELTELDSTKRFLRIRSIRKKPFTLQTVGT